MEGPIVIQDEKKMAYDKLQIVRYSPFQACTQLSPLAWFDLKVFYFRISHLQVDDSTPDFLTVNHIPLSPDTLLEVNGARSSMHSEGIYSLLRRDRADKRSEEATFVSTDSIRLTGSVKYQVFKKEALILSGVLEMGDSNGFTQKSNDNVKRWGMDCEAEVTAGTGFLKGKNIAGPEFLLPTIEVYVAGCFCGTPIILTKTLQLTFRKKHNRKSMLDAIPEYETAECQKDGPSSTELQLARLRNYNKDNHEDCSNMYWQRTEYQDGEDGELSWFNAGVRVGVGIGLGICIGLGLGVGLMVRTYQSTTRNFKRRLL